ncbi:MAG: site-specific DNA-methyltransferase [Chlorobi bacterium]|nr:site-specific DNA-methyltransferase [Chlorobiota bacterium]
MAKKDYKNWDKNDLIKEIEQLRKRKKYGLVWEDKPENVVEQCKTELPVLEEVKSKEIITNSDKPMNLLIEGDNYHALSVLNYTHKGKVDVIYIDPPYNTGARDWKYNNDYVDENDQWRHSKWISFMNNRLKQCKKLLSRNGVLVCTIDHNEQENLGILLKEIFPTKDITCVTIVHNPAGIQGQNFSYSHEYAYFVYPKGGRFIGYQYRDDDKKDVRNFRDVTGDSSLRGAAKNCFYPILIKNGEIVGFGDVSPSDYHPDMNVNKGNGLIEVYPIDPSGIERKWRYARHTVEKIQKELGAKFIKKRGVWDIVRTKNKFNYKTVWNDTRYFANNYGTQILNRILPPNIFSYPKSLYAVIDCIDAAGGNRKNITVLDFFAGSGTTGHAVLELNKDGGNRKFILCTNNEDNNGNGGKIATDICYPRIANVINGYSDQKDQKQIESLGGNLKYYKTTFVSADLTDTNKTKLTKKATEMLCVKEDTFEKVKSNAKYKIFRSKKKYIGIIYDHLAIDDFKKEIAKIDGKFSVYIFSLGDDTFDEEFEDVKNKVKLSPIPEAILRVYRRIFK